MSREIFERIDSRSLNVHADLSVKHCDRSALEITSEVPLGGGATSVVWPGKYCSAHVAIKVVKGIDEPNQRVAFEREVAGLAMLEHANIVRMEAACACCVDDSLDARLHGGVIVLQRHRCSLFSFLFENRESCHTALGDVLLWNVETVLGVARALRELHSVFGLACRDLKTLNVLLDDQLRPVLADLGTLRPIDCTLQTARVGTAMYLPPEGASKTMDVWAFGMLAYEVFARQLPFPECEWPSEIAQRLASGALPSLDDVPSDIAELIRQCWSRDQSERPTFDAIVDCLAHCRLCLLSPAVAASSSSSSPSSSLSSPSPSSSSSSSPLTWYVAGFAGTIVAYSLFKMVARSGHG
jgi:mitogen-activated protein kinase kinase kinase 7